MEAAIGRRGVEVGLWFRIGFSRLLPTVMWELWGTEGRLPGRKVVVGLEKLVSLVPCLCCDVGEFPFSDRLWKRFRTKEVVMPCWRERCEV